MGSCDLVSKSMRFAVDNIICKTLSERVTRGRTGLLAGEPRAMGRSTTRRSS